MNAAGTGAFFRPSASAICRTADRLELIFDQWGEPVGLLTAEAAAHLGLTTRTVVGGRQH